ncbi:rab-GTPase-TBC domain-containing protein [Halteromyces radiatus]|uniref:rab-GTPase-TBC domain-containing protein n=1 Tax=Halteromyces radiatus TaxID=101107 RepID=UPI0022205297|nr:rab-GTPase-TBC domain-containing protein [Halteromyces radiatus]KAI8093217.1 rab-GTPase-TBC domain-containing protein [Halteromyces radiatus]
MSRDTCTLYTMGGGASHSPPVYYNPFSSVPTTTSTISIPLTASTATTSTTPTTSINTAFNDMQIHPRSSKSQVPPPLPPVPYAYTIQQPFTPSPAPLPLQQQQQQQQQQQLSSLPTQSRRQPQPQTVRLVYTKSAFYLKERNRPPTHGYFTIISNSLTEDNLLLYIAWIPQHLIDPIDWHKFLTLDSALPSDQGFPTIQLHMGYGETTVIALSNIHSLYVRPPTTDLQGSIVITTTEGDVLRPLWYQPTNPFDASWPGYNIIDILGAFVEIEKATDDEYVYILLPNLTTEQNATTATTTTTTVTDYHTADPISSSHPLISPSSSSSSITETPYSSLREARWTILERFSRITKASRETAAHILDHPVAQPIVPLLPTSIQALGRNGTVQETMRDYNVASYYLTQWAAEASLDPLSDDERYADGLLSDIPEMQQPLPNHSRREPISPEEWIDFFDQDGVLCVSLSHVHKLIFQGGLHADVRIEAWKFLLGIYPWQSTFDEREAIRRSKAEEYFDIKAKWFNDMETRNSKQFLDEKHRIDKDVHRTDRNIDFFAGEDLPNPDPQMAVGTNANLEIMKDILVTYNFHNTTLGYVQGMSDLCAPMFVGMGDEAMAFWGFVKFMDRVQSNFFTDQSGMHRQLKSLDALLRFMDPDLYKHFEETETTNLFFCFRWLLVWFKREFDWEDVIRLWEVLWTDHLSKQFLLFVALSVLHQHRQTILTELGQFDELLKYINQLTGNISLNKTLETAEVLFYQFERRIKAMDKKQAKLQEKLQQRSVWNNEKERNEIQAALKKLYIDPQLRELLTK